MLIAASVLAANFTNLAGDFNRINRSGADLIHLDVMDGQFVPPISFGAQIVAALRPLTKLDFDVHLMVNTPAKQLQAFIDAGANWLTFHLEAELHAHRLMMQIKNAGCYAGVAVVPSTPISALSELLPELDLVLVMTVNPGYGGQQMLPNCVKKVAQLAALRQHHGYNYRISVDGGVNQQTSSLVLQAGADILVSGSAFFQADDVQRYCQQLRHGSSNKSDAI